MRPPHRGSGILLPHVALPARRRRRITRRHCPLRRRAMGRHRSSPAASHSAPSSSTSAGTFLLGLLGGTLAGRLVPHGDDLRLALGVGFLGAFTTFSTFEMETHALLDDGVWSMAVVNVCASVLVGLLALRAGRGAARRSGSPDEVLMKSRGGTGPLPFHLSNFAGHRDEPLYQWIVETARRDGLQGATVLKGIAGLRPAARCSSSRPGNSPRNCRSSSRSSTTAPRIEALLREGRAGVPGGHDHAGARPGGLLSGDDGGTGRPAAGGGA